MPDISPSHGLTEVEAIARLRIDGPNTLPRSEHRTPGRILFDVIREPMLALLLLGGLLYLALGDLGEAAVLMLFALLSTLITVIQEARTERVLETLRDLTSPHTLVLRDGRRRQIASRDVVCGDLVVLSEGDRVPADGRLVACDHMLVDESLLTGESVPVRKREASDAHSPAPRPGGEDLQHVFSGSLIVRGAGIAEIVATGSRSEIGKIGHALTSVAAEPSRMQMEIGRLVRIFGALAGVICVSALLLQGLLRGGWLNALLSAIALGMAMLPEEFPVVLTVFMAMGAWRISRAHVLTRRASAIEALGAVTVLCTDKTGTLTENRMSVTELRLAGGETLRPDPAIPLPARYRDLARYSILATPREPFDPMERALQRLGEDHLDDKGVPALDWRMVRSFGLRPDLLAMTQVWETRDAAGPRLVIAAKGAPEAIMELCRCDEAERGRLMAMADTMAREGLRVLGIARADGLVGQVPASQRDLTFSFIGFVGLADALRASVPAAVADCRRAGVRVVMITGDYPVTARAIANQAGIDAGGILTGETLAAMTEGELLQSVRTTAIFARIMPEQKLRIVNALKLNGDVVAMTGDGVNDAPSLKAAHIGIAMGGRGTDVAREAAAIVLLDDNFSSIVTAIRLGRRIHDNLRKAIAFILAVHVPIAGLALLPLLFGFPSLLSPVHIAFLEMIIDPVCTLVFEAEAEETDIMSRAPRKPDEPLFSVPLLAWGLLQGVVVLAAIATIFVVALNRGVPEAETRALTFFSLVMTLLGLVLVNRAFSASLVVALRRPGRVLLAVIACVLVMLTLTLVWPYARGLFRFGALHVPGLLLALAAGAVVLAVLEVVKPSLRQALFDGTPPRAGSRKRV